MMDRMDSDDASWRALIAEGRGPLIGILILGIWLNAADALVTVTLMPSVALSLGGYAYFAWAAAGFMLGGIVASASSGFLATHIGLKRALLLSGLTYLIGCVASAAAPDIGWFLLGRLVQGVGAGWIVGLVFVVIGVVLPEHLAARVFSVLASVWGAATLLGPLVGGVFGTLGLWRWAFWAFAIQSGLFVWGVAVLAPKDKARSERPEGAPWVQLVLVAAGVFAIALAGVRPGGEAVGWLALGVVLLAAVPWVDRRMSTRLLPLAATKVSSTSAAGYAAVFLLSAGAIPHSVYTPVLLQRIHGVSPLVAGYVVAAEAMAWSLIAMFVGGAKRPGRLIRAGAICVGLGMLALAFTVGHAPLLIVALAAGLMGAGFGLSFAFMSARVIEGIEEEGERALASSAVPTVQALGAAVGAALAGVAGGLLGLGKPFDIPTASAAALPLFGAFVPVLALGALAAWRLGREQVNV
jgi:MFS family permease